MGDGQRERCLVNGREVEREEELKSQEVSIRESRLAEEPGEFWSSAAASLKPSVRVIISVRGVGQAQNDAGGGITRVGAGGGGDGGSSSAGGVVAAARLEATVQRAASESWAGRQWSAAAAVETAAIGRCRLSRLCPVGQACAVPCVQLCHRACLPLVWALMAVGAGSRGWAGAERRDEGRADRALAIG